MSQHPKKIDGKLRGIHADNSVALARTVEDHLVVWFDKPDVGTNIGGPEIQSFRQSGYIICVDCRESSWGDGRDSLGRGLTFISAVLAASGRC
ncbi:MAG: hypothetical protein ACYC0U_02115, partial [Ilumatobacteraceae bacterium]